MTSFSTLRMGNRKRGDGMKLEYDAGKLSALSEQELKALHKELIQLEEDAHKARGLAWRELMRRRPHVSEQTREERRQVRYREKIRDYEKQLEREKSPGIRKMIEGALANLKLEQLADSKRVT